jgi:nitroreductase
MELSAAIAQRRAVRDYLETPVERTVIEALIGDAALAPSARNAQPWAFAVLQDRRRISEYARRAKQWLLDHPPLEGFGGLDQQLHDPKFSIFYNASAVVMILAKDDARQSSEDCCLAAGTFMLAARARGLGTCWIGLARPWLDQAATRTELGLPANYRVVAPIILGYPKTWPESHGRNPPEIHWLAN